ncbi:protein sprouty homolog 4 [Frankliniella occidentalis]|uniref:Protein sprouty homolog 4 n=1 Tax=Frankliniella occidentalis TaxID=133901 RepID=A0A9C6U1M6_FRAOC|nr:protein sprouty homolog 4 [Frankliniella occidentalis]
MAHHGGRTAYPPQGRPLGTPRGTPVGTPLALPRVHRPPPSTPSPPPRPLPPTPGPGAGPPPNPLAAPALPPSPVGAPLAVPPEVEVSLSTPRPDGERRANEYVEAPLHHRVPGGGRGGGVRTSAASCRVKKTSAAASPAGCPPAREPRHHHRTTVTLPVRQQPTTFKKEPPAGAPAPHLHPALLATPTTPMTPSPSIMCPECGRCRCEACREPRPLPSRWLCDDACFCSAETTLDYATCLCCVKGLFYHCGNPGDEGGVWCADDPCSCAGATGGAGARRCARWSCLAVASVALPCLLCYWPLRGLVRATELCYARYCDDGCRCDRRPPRPARTSSPGGQRVPALTTPEKRLLDTD